MLLPKKQVPEGTKTGDTIRVFIYKDSEDRLIATTAMPKLQVGETALLKVNDVSKIGAFLDMGLEKDVLLPFKEQNPQGQSRRGMPGCPLCGQERPPGGNNEGLFVFK